MKPIVIVGALVASLLAGFAGATVAVRMAMEKRATEQAHAAELSTNEVAARARPSESGEALTPSYSDSADIAALKQALTAMQREIDDLRAQLGRREVESGVARADQLPTDVSAYADLQRDAVVKILEDEKKREQDKRDQERKEREQEMFNRMAERAAKDLGLSPADQQRLADFMPIASAKRDEVFRAARDSGGPEGFRAAFDEYRTWRDTELKGTFGDALGQQLIDYQSNQRGGMDGGFGGFGGGFGGGPGSGGGTNQGGASQQGGRTGGGRGR